MLIISTTPMPLRLDEDGAVRIAQTRVLLEMLIEAYQQGYSAEEISLQYDAVSLADVYATIAYYLAHTAEVEAYLQAVRQAGIELRQRIEGEAGYEEKRRALRQRLLKRQSGEA